jgi:hypothetical protein
VEVKSVVNIYISFDSGCHTNMDDTSTDYDSVSNCDVLRINYKWSIKNFSKNYCPDYRGHDAVNIFISAPFELSNRKVSTKWCFILEQHGVNLYREPCIEVKFGKVLSESDQAVKIHYKFTIMGSSDEEIMTQDWQEKVFSQPTSSLTLWTWNSNVFERFVKDDKFTIAKSAKNVRNQQLYQLSERIGDNSIWDHSTGSKWNRFSAS